MNELNWRERDSLRQYFSREIFPTLTPLAIDPTHPFPHISNLSFNLAVVVKDPDRGECFARVKLPDVFRRLVSVSGHDEDAPKKKELEGSQKSQRFVWLEEIVADNLDLLFPGLEIAASYPFRVTRDAEVTIKDDEAPDLITAVEEQLDLQDFGSVVRLELDATTPKHIAEILAKNLQLPSYLVYTGDDPIGMDTVQNLRQRASANGTLQSTDQVRIDHEEQNISITSPDPQVVYVPYYDPLVVYGSWWWPAYPPVYWRPWPGYFVGPRPGYAWGPGITVGTGFFFGAFDWPHRQVNVVTVNNFYYHNTATRAWTHDPVHRRGVSYREASLRQQYGRAPASPPVRQDFRGHYPSPASPGSRESFGNRAARSSFAGRSPMSAPSGFRTGESRPHAFEGVGHGASASNYGTRGNASFHHGGGGGGGGHSGGGRGHGGGGGHRGR